MQMIKTIWWLPRVREGRPWALLYNRFAVKIRASGFVDETRAMWDAINVEWAQPGVVG